MIASFGPDQNLQVGYGLVIPTRWSVALQFWPVTLSHILVFLPAAWLIPRRPRMV